MEEKATDEEIAKILRLPDGEEGINTLHKMLTDLGSELTEAEKLFILLYTSPLSKICGNMRQCSFKAGKSKNMGAVYLQRPHVKKVISELQDKVLLDEIKEALTEDARRCIRVLNTDRSEFRKDSEFTFNRKDNGEQVTVEKIVDKPIYELTKNQREAIADFTYDKNGDAHPVIEKRSEARAALQNYQKLYGGLNVDNENKSTETVVTLEAIKNKTIAKISVIQKNNDDAIKAGDFIDSMVDKDEEA